MERKNNRRTRALGTRFAARQDGDARCIEGYFAVFGSVYELWPGATESVDPAAFDGALDDDIRALCDHETRLVLGRTKAGTLELKADEHGLWGRITINVQDADAMNLYARVQRGDVDQCSFGFDILDEESIYNADGSVHWIIKRVKLYEVSVVTFPAYEETAVQARKQDAKLLAERRTELWKNNLKERMTKYAQNP